MSYNYKKVDFVDSGGSKNNKDDFDGENGLVNEGIVGGGGGRVVQ